jgi:hypothetical protein
MSKLSYKLEISDHPTHDDFAKILYQKLGDNLRCKRINNHVGIYFQYNNNRWNKILEDEYGLIVSKAFKEVIEDAIVEVKKEINSQVENDEQPGSSSSKTIDTINMKLIKLCRIQKNSLLFGINVKKILSEYIFDNYMRMLDHEKDFLIAFNDGVYESKTKVFRSGSNKDLISTGVNCNYGDVKDDPTLNRLLHIMDTKDIFYIERTFNMFLTKNEQNQIIIITNDRFNMSDHNIIEYSRQMFKVHITASINKYLQNKIKNYTYNYLAVVNLEIKHDESKKLDFVLLSTIIIDIQTLKTVYENKIIQDGNNKSNLKIALECHQDFLTNYPNSIMVNYDYEQQKILNKNCTKKNINLIDYYKNIIEIQKSFCILNNTRSKIDMNGMLDFYGIEKHLVEGKADNHENIANLAIEMLNSGWQI